MINAHIKTRRIQSQHTRIGSVSVHKELSEREIKKKKKPYNGVKIIRYLGMNLALEVKNLYSENYKMVMKLKKTQRSGKIFPLLRLKKFNIVKMSTLPKLIYNQRDSYQNSNGLFSQNRKRTNLKFNSTHQRYELQKQFEKKNLKAGGRAPPDFKLILYSYSNLNNMVLAEKQTHR